MLRKIWRFTKRILAVLFILLILAVIGIAIFVMTFDLNRYKDLAAQKLSIILDRPVTIESMHTKLALIPTITITGFKIDNNDPFKNKDPLLSIKKMDAELELAPLLNSQINIHKIDMDAAEIHLFKNADKNNWTISSTQKEDPATKTTPKASNAKLDLQKNLQLNLVTIGTLNISYDDSKEKHALTINKLEMRNFHMLKGDLVYNNQTFTFNLNAGTIFDALNQKPNFPVDLKIQSRLANANINGKIGNLKALTGLQATASMRTNNLKNLFNFFGIKSPLIPTQNAQLQIQVTGDINNLTIKQANFNINSDKDLTFSSSGSLKDLMKTPILTLDIKSQLLENKLTDLWRVQPMSLSGDITLTPTSFKSKTITIDANRSDVRLAVDMNLNKNKKYNISAALVSNFLNIYDFIKKPENKATTANTTSAPKNNTTSNQIPWDMLTKANLNLNLNVKHMQANDWFTDYIGIKTQSTLYDGILNFPYEISIFNGTLNGTLNANSNKKTIVLDARGSRLNLNGLRPLAQELKDVILETKITANTKGADVPSLITNLNGQLVAETNQGQIINKWFTNLPKLLNLNKKKQNVSFSNTDSNILINCAAANINVMNGVVTGQDQIALETNAIDVTAGGTIDLKNNTMDVLVQPALSDGTADEWTSLTKYIRISGPFAKLTPRVDTKKAADTLLQAGVSKLIGAEAQTTTTATTKTAGAMCQKVLGKNTLVQKKEPEQKAQPAATKTTQQPQTQPTDQKQQFKQQLLDSLFQALTPQQ